MTTQKMLGFMRKAIQDYHMIADGDRVAVGISGGKDSISLLTVLNAFKRFSPQKFELEAINIDMGFENINKQEQKAQSDYIESLGIDFHVVKSDIADVVFNQRKEQNPCSLCSKMRRGALNTKAIELGCNKIALGHHADDLIETLFLSLFYEGRLSTFAPKSYMTRTKITLIRPLIYTDEKNIRAYSENMPIVHNPCPSDKHTKRQYMKDLIKKVQEDIPFIKQRMHTAITHPERYNLWWTEENESDFDDIIAKQIERENQEI